METIKKDGLVIEINRHKLQIEKIQQIVNDMLNEGFNFSSDELKDLRGDCNSLHKTGGRYGTERCFTDKSIVLSK